MDITEMLHDLLKVEGGYSNDPNDAGGETNHGVTIAVARANGYQGPMRDLTKAQALEIYRQQYFFKPGYGLVFEVAPTVAAEIFDSSVNCGPGVASRWLQRCLNVLNPDGKLYADLAVDGMVGKSTVAALSALISKYGLDETEDLLLKMLNSLQGNHYITLAEKRQTDQKFVRGWFLNRVGMPT